MASLKKHFGGGQGEAFALQNLIPIFYAHDVNPLLPSVCVEDGTAPFELGFLLFQQLAGSINLQFPFYVFVNGFFGRN